MREWLNPWSKAIDPGCSAPFSRCSTLMSGRVFLGVFGCVLLESGEFFFKEVLGAHEVPD